MRPSEKLTIVNLLVVLCVVTATSFLDRNELALIKILLLLALILNGTALVREYWK